MGSDQEAKYIQHVVEMESCLVGGALVLPEQIETVSEIVQREDFRDPVLGQVWGILEDLIDAGSKVTPQVVLSEVKKRGFSDQFGKTEYGRLVVNNGLAAHLQYYAEEVARLSNHRKMVWAARLIGDGEFDIDFDPKKRFAEFESKTQSAFADTSDGVWLSEAVEKAIGKHREAGKTNVGLSIPTGYRDFDAVVGGYFPGHVMMIAARSFMGKTTFALNLACKLVRSKKNALFFSLEMTSLDLAERVLSFVHSIPFSHFNRGLIGDAQIDQLADDVKIFDGWRMKIYQRPRQSIRQIRAIARMHKVLHGLDVIFIDHLQLIAPSDMRLQRNERLLDNADKIKELAKELNVTIVLLNQLNAGADGEEPDDTHLSGSKEVITSVDEMVYIHRQTKTSRETLLKITKARKAGEGADKGGSRWSSTVRFNGFETFGNKSYCKKTKSGGRSGGFSTLVRQGAVMHSLEVKKVREVWSVRNRGIWMPAIDAEPKFSIVDAMNKIGIQDGDRWTTQLNAIEAAGYLSNIQSEIDFRNFEEATSVWVEIHCLTRLIRREAVPVWYGGIDWAQLAIAIGNLKKEFPGWK